MARQVEGNVITGTAPGALGMHLRVKGPLTALVLAGLGAADEPVELGTLEKAAFAAGDVVPIRERCDRRQRGDLRRGRRPDRDGGQRRPSRHDAGSLDGRRRHHRVHAVLSDR
jgi:hypothetical protein